MTASSNHVDCSAGSGVFYRDHEAKGYRVIYPFQRSRRNGVLLDSDMNPLTGDQRLALDFISSQSCLGGMHGCVSGAVRGGNRSDGSVGGFLSLTSKALSFPKSKPNQDDAKKCNNDRAAGKNHHPKCPPRHFLLSTKIAIGAFILAVSIGIGILGAVKAAGNMARLDEERKLAKLAGFIAAFFDADRATGLDWRVRVAVQTPID